MPKNDGNGGAYLKLEDGTAVTGVFRGEVFEFFQIWPYGGDKQVFATRVPGSSSRFKINFVTQEGGKFVAKVWEIGLSVYNQLADIAEEYDLEVTKVKITRRGEGKATNYMVLPLIKEKIPKAAMAEIEAVKLNALDAHLAPVPTPPGKFDDETGGDDSEEVPF
jgi:hypothetical protein